MFCGRNVRLSFQLQRPFEPQDFMNNQLIFINNIKTIVAKACYESRLLLQYRFLFLPLPICMTLQASMNYRL